MARFAFCFVLAALMAGCKPPERTPVTAGGPDEVVIDQALTPQVFGVGDVEFHTHTVANINQQHAVMAQPNIRVEVIEDGRERVSRVIADIFPPHPDEVWVRVATFCVLGFPEHAIVMKTRIFVDSEEVDSFEYVTGADAFEPRTRDIEVLQYFSERPGQFIVHAETDITLYKDTNASEITPETAPPATAEQKATRLSNPLRIQFR